MIWQTINYSRLVDQLLPDKLNQSKTVNLLKSFLSVLQKIADETLYKMQHNCQVIYLEKVLNEHYEIADYDLNNHVATRKIYISDAPINERDFIHLNQEPETMWLFEENDPGTAEDDIEYIDVMGGAAYHFIINIPTIVVFNEVTLRTLVDFYKLGGKKYIIQTYEL